MDDDSGPTASIICFLVIVLIDLYLYGFGAAVKALTQKDLEKYEQEGDDPRTARLQAIMDNPKGFVNTLQLIVTLSHVILGYFCLSDISVQVKGWTEPLINRLEGRAFLQETLSYAALILTVVVLLYIVLTLGILLPKKLAAKRAENWAYSCVNTVTFLIAFWKGPTLFINRTVNGILDLFGLRDNGAETDVTEEGIISMVNEGHEQGIIQASEAEMINNIFEYGDKEAQEIMTQRNNIIAVDSMLALDEVLDFILSENYSRYPVYEENIDHIVGILHLKDAMRMHKENPDMKLPVKEIPGLLREPTFVHRAKKLDELFKEMQSEKLQMVIVIDEYGQTDGLVAMEDILEEIVGNIMDEYDEDTEYIEEKGNDEYIIEGMTPLEELEERFDISFGEVEFETLNGFLISKLDKIPDEDEVFDVDVDGYNFKILKVENKRVTSVLVTKVLEETEE